MKDKKCKKLKKATKQLGDALKKDEKTDKALSEAAKKVSKNIK